MALESWSGCHACSYFLVSGRVTDPDLCKTRAMCEGQKLLLNLSIKAINHHKSTFLIGSASRSRTPSAGDPFLFAGSEQGIC